MPLGRERDLLVPLVLTAGRTINHPTLEYAVWAGASKAAPTPSRSKSPALGLSCAVRPWPS